jgi:hypothetical protein
LHVSGNIAAAVDPALSGFVQLWADNALIYKSGNGNGGLRFGTATNLSAGGRTEKMRITDGGDVGIGTQIPHARLDVFGVPDYVFDEKYSLRPLDSVSSYIRANHHLPEIPSADSVAKSGLDLGDNQAQLLKKIDELTLYAIQQQQQIEAQNKEMKEMRTEMETLKKVIKK